MAIKKSMESLVAFMALTSTLTMTVAELNADPKFIKLVTAQKGGFSGEDQFVTVDGVKVGRVCALTGGVFAHDNSDKEVSYFYKNGSYMIGAEVLKANERKAWELNKEDDLQELEDLMMSEDDSERITPKEWKLRATEVNAREFDYTMSDEDKAMLNDTFGACADKAEFEEAYKNGDIEPFSTYAEDIKALRDLAPKRVTVEDEAEDQADEA